MQSQKLDIVDLIETNPITKLSKNYQGKFLEKIQNTFTETEQRLFVSSLYNYLNYDSKKDFIIDMSDIWKWLGFSRKEHCKVVLEKHFTKDIDYKIQKAVAVAPRENKATEVAVASKIRGIAGLNKEKILMTINTFKKLCLKSNTKKADEIHDYFIKLEELTLETITEESTELRIQLQEKNQEIQQIQNDRINDKKLEKHNILLEKLNNKDCIYLIEITNNNKPQGVIYEIKLGSTSDLKKRWKDHCKTYGECIILDAFESDQFRKVEHNILKDPIVYNNKANYQINGKISFEVVKISESFNYEQLLKIVKDYIKNGLFFVSEHILEVKKLDNEKLKLELQKIQLESEKLKLEYITQNNLEFTKVLQFLNNHQPQLRQQEVQHPQEIPQQPEPDVKEIHQEQRQVQPNLQQKNLDEFKIKLKQTRGRRIQQIDPDNLQNIIKVYPSMIILLRENIDLNLYKQNVQKAIKENTLYKGFRWKFLELGQDPNIVHNIEPTVNKLTKNIECILQLNLDKNQILNTFTGIKGLSEKIQKPYKFVKKFVDSNEIYDGFYYLRISQCPNNILNIYTKPIKEHFTKKIIQIDPSTKQEIIHKSINNVCLKLCGSESALLEAINEKLMYKGSFWKFQ
jgi:hypothetical protein